MLLAISPSTAEAGKRRRYRSVHVVHAAPLYVAPARVYARDRAYVAPAPAISRRYRAPVHVVAPGVRVRVGGYGGVSVNVGRWGW
ncbi:MAG: hypothetical protein CMJ64_27530 [Planctomycetaceae bacterium]|jgi:methyl coenzyme M reductase gamma subunit|nr:hypothetical protein [Planctomycetaceae bacterium]